jgi:hypothetical protein
MKINGKAAAIAAAMGNGTLAQIGRKIVYSLNGRAFTWNCRTVAEASETLAVFQELARRQLEKDAQP